MIKKILGWSLFAIFVGLIIFGAINRTDAKLSDSSPARESNQSQGQNEGGNRGQSGNDSSEAETEHESESTDLQATPAPTVAILTTSSPDDDLATFTGDSEHEWLTLSGTVLSVTNKVLTVTREDGQSLLIERRPWRFAQENGFTTSPGNQLEIIGFIENDLFQIAQIHDLTTDLLVRLRDETGHPLWASE